MPCRGEEELGDAHVRAGKRLVGNPVVDRAPSTLDASTSRTRDVVERVHVARGRGRWGGQREQPTDGVSELLGFGKRKGSALGRISGLAPAAPAPGAPLLAALALAAGLGSLPRLVLGLQLIPPGVVPRSASLLLENGDGFGGKPLELRAFVVKVLEGAPTLEEMEQSRAGRRVGRSPPVVPAPAVPRGVRRC